MAQEQRPDDPRETLWGIKPEDRPWFQTLTIVGGTVVAIVNTLDRLNGGPGPAPENPLLYRIATDIVTGYLAAGLTTWTLLYVKEVIVTLADVIRRKAQEREDRRVREAEERAEARAMETVEARAMEMAEARADARARELVKEQFMQMIDQLNRNEADSSVISINREDLLQLLQDQRRDPDSNEGPDD